jgi:hypothetical protein
MSLGYHSGVLDQKGEACRNGAEEGQMNELEPDTEPSQWLWFGAALLAMTVISLIVSFPR